MQRILVLFLIVCLSSNLYAQKVHVNGIITENSTGLPLPGATIQIKNSPETSVTDRNGSFRMYALPGDELEVKFVGFVTKTIIAPADERILHITMDEDVRLLNEVVVTGALGIRRAARELGGGAQVVNNKELNQGKTINPVTGLTSKVAGLRINMYDSKVDPQVQVVMRGTRSLNRNANAPIYVVDGVPIPNIGRLNPNDIESITVLKGANAAALYGSEGVNGAIMITTKKGKSGKGAISFSNTTTLSSVYMLPETQTTYGQGFNGTYSPTTYESWGPKFDGSLRPFGDPLPNGTQPVVRYAAPGS